MKKVALRFGLYSAITITALFLLKWVFLGNDNFGLQETLGWASMVLALLFVFFGIKQYRDTVSHGSLTFGRGMKVGLLIVLIASTAFGLFDLVYITLNPDFFDKYYNYKLAEMQQTLSSAELESWKKEYQSTMQIVQKPIVNFLVMFATVFIIGVIISVISSLILMRKPKPALA